MPWKSVLFAIFFSYIWFLEFVRSRVWQFWAVSEALLIIKVALFRKRLPIRIALMFHLFFSGFCWCPWTSILPIYLRKRIEMVMKIGGLSFRLNLIFLS